MFFSKLSLRNFGSFDTAEFSFSEQGLNVIHGGNGTGKTQAVGAIFAALMGESAVRVDKTGVGPSEVHLSIVETGDAEDLTLTVTLHDDGEPVVQRNSHPPGDGHRGGSLSLRLTTAISNPTAPRILLGPDVSRTTLTPLEIDVIERSLPGKLKQDQTWQSFRAQSSVKSSMRPGGHWSLGTLLREFAARAQFQQSLPLIVDEFLGKLSDEHAEFSMKLLGSIAERSQVIVLTNRMRTMSCARLESLDHARERSHSLAYYNGFLYEKPPYLVTTTPERQFAQTSMDPNDNEADATEEFVLDPKKPLVLILGLIDHEGILSSLKSSGRQYKRKMLESTVANWDSIVQYFADFKISCVLGKLTADVCSLISNEEYSEIRTKLFERIAAVPNLFFAYEDILLGERNPNPPKEILDAALRFIGDYRIEIVPVKASSELTVIAESFLDDTERNLIFRLYVPSGKLWASEADKFLQLFQDYLSRVDGLSVRLDQMRTDHGTIYEFHGKPPRTERSLSAEFQDFSRLMDLCAADTDAAARLLATKNLNTLEVRRIVEKYVKEARRLQLDIKHEAESKMISLRHRVESELIELAPTAQDWNVISAIVDAAVPHFSSCLPAPSQALGVIADTGATRAAHITYNIRPQFIQTVNGIVAEEMNGTQHFESEYKQLLDFVRTHARDKSTDIETAVYELADNSGRQVDKLKATQKIKSFLIDASKRLGKETVSMAFDILQKIVEKKMGL